MNDYESQSLALLTKIESHLAQLASRGIVAQVANTTAGGFPHPAAGGPRPPATAFSEADIKQQGEYANPHLDRNPSRWEGESVVGKYMSDLSPDTLRALAVSYEGLASWHDSKGNVDNKGRPKGDWAYKDARRALYWAEKNGRSSRPRPAPAPPPAAEVDAYAEAYGEDIPF